MKYKKVTLLFLLVMLLIPFEALAAYPPGSRDNLDTGGVLIIPGGYQWNNHENYAGLKYKLMNPRIDGNYDDYMYESNWFTSIDGRDPGKRMMLMRPRSAGGSGRTLAQSEDVSWWGSQLNGNPNYVQRTYNANPTVVESIYTGTQFNRAYSRDLAMWSGALIRTEGTGDIDDGPNGSLLLMGRAVFTTTPFPTPHISAPSNAAAGQSIKVDFTGREYYPHDAYSTTPEIHYELKLNGKVLKKGMDYASTFSDSHIISSGICAAGTYRFELTLTDRVERSTTVTKPITITGDAEDCDGPGEGPDEPEEDPKPEIPPPDLSCTFNINVSDDGSMNSDPNNKLADPMGKITESNESREFDVLKYGIPSSEYVQVEGESEKFLSDYLYRHMKGLATYQVSVTKDYLLRWQEGDRIRYEHVRRQEFVQDPYPVSYWQIGHLTIHSFSNAAFRNYALPNELVDVTNTNQVNASHQHSTNVRDHVFPKDCNGVYLGVETIEGGTSKPSAPNPDLSGPAGTGNRAPDVKNDKVLVDGNLSMSDSRVPLNGPNPTPIPRAPKVKVNKASLLIDPLKVNKWETSSSITSYYKVAYTVNSTARPLDFTGNSPEKINTVTVHTPVVMYGRASDDKDYDQRVDPPERSTPANSEEDRHAIVLDRPFTVSLPTTGQHLDESIAPGYGNRDFSKYVRKDENGQAFNEVKFPFDVYTETKQGFYPKETWIKVPITMEEIELFLPSWVPEGEYEVKFRSIAINSPGSIPEEQQEESLANLNMQYRTPNEVMDKHIAIAKIDVDVIGRLYDFRLTDILDYQWESVFRTTEGLIEHTGNYYWVGDKMIDGDLRGNEEPFVLPVRHGSHPEGFKNLAVKTGYQFKFDMKTMGSMAKVDDAISIKPSFYFVNKDGSNRRPVDVYYHSDSDYFVKIGSDKDKMYREIKLNEPLRNVEKKQIYDTADYIYRHPDEFGYGPIVEDIHELSTFARKFERDYSKRPTTTGTYSWQMLNRNLRTLIGIDAVDVPSNSMVPPEDVKASKQQWYGEYSLPADVYVVEQHHNIAGYGVQHRLSKNSPIFLQDGYIIVNFDIETIANGDTENPRLSYHKAPLSNQWEREGFKYDFIDPYGNKFDLIDGDVIFYHGDQSSYDDFGTSVTH